MDVCFHSVCLVLYAFFEPVVTKKAFLLCLEALQSFRRAKILGMKYDFSALIFIYAKKKDKKGEKNGP